MADQNSAEQIWLPVIGKALAQLCLHSADMGGKTIRERAVFLVGLGIEIEDCAKMLGTTPGSVRELLRLSKMNTKRRGPKKNAARKKNS